jgi:hypothetical protein
MPSFSPSKVRDSPMAAPPAHRADGACNAAFRAACAHAARTAWLQRHLGARLRCTHTRGAPTLARRRAARSPACAPRRSPHPPRRTPRTPHAPPARASARAACSRVLSSHSACAFLRFCARSQERPTALWRVLAILPYLVPLMGSLAFGTELCANAALMLSPYQKHPFLIKTLSLSRQVRHLPADQLGDCGLRPAAERLL